MSIEPHAHQNIVLRCDHSGILYECFFQVVASDTSSLFPVLEDKQHLSNNVNATCNTILPSMQHTYIVHCVLRVLPCITKHFITIFLLLAADLQLYIILLLPLQDKSRLQAAEVTAALIVPRRI